MELFRICLKKFSKNLGASGQPGRWNLRGQNIIYTASSRSLAALEMVVRGNALTEEESYKIMVISVTDNENLIEQVFIRTLPEDWRTLAAYGKLQEIGSEWVKESKSLLLKVPSVVIPQEYNYAINFDHPDFKKNVKLVRVEDYFWDERLVH